jgi:PhnB protein
MGNQTVIPRMVVRDLFAAVAFLRTVFGTTGEAEGGRRAMVRDPFQMAHQRG